MERRTNSDGCLHILLATLGSAGDVFPLIELGIALQKRGHTATIITNESFAEPIRDSSLNFIGMGTKFEAEQVIADPRLWHPSKSFECIVERVIAPNISRLYEIIRAHRTSNTVVGASAVCLGARIAQENLGVPLASIELQPTLLRSLIDAGMQGRLPMGPNVPRWAKKAYFSLVDTFLIDRLLGAPLNAFRATLGLPKVRGVFAEYIHSPELVLGLFPDWFAPPQPDWPAKTHLTGFVLRDSGEQAPVAAEVEEFLAGGSPPVLFTPGSGAAMQTRFFRESIEACRLAGLRAMLVTNYLQQIPNELPPGVRAFSYVPFSEILSRCSALVYHGGVGTLAQGIKAGLPHLVVPNSLDQPDNGRRVQHLGLGYSIYPERYTAPHVAQVLGQLLNSATIRQRCQEYSARIDSHAALQKACALIETLL